MRHGDASSAASSGPSDWLLATGPMEFPREPTIGARYRPWRVTNHGGTTSSAALFMNMSWPRDRGSNFRHPRELAA